MEDGCGAGSFDQALTFAFAQHAHSVAIETADGAAVTYARLLERTEVWRGWLARRGVGRGTRVAIDLGAPLACIECIVACARIGAVYVPIDPATPAAGKAAMLAAAAADLHVTDETAAQLDRASPGKAMRTPAAPAGDDDPLAIMFTSGSTSAPKGVIFRSGGIVPLVVGPDTYMPLAASDRVLQLSARSFDAFVWELWGVLLNGACLLLLPQKWGLSDVAAALTQRRISAMFVTARLFDTMIDTMPDALRGLRLIGFGGEAASGAHVARALALLPETTLVNGYGPSENTTFSLSWIARAPLDPDLPVPLGEPRGGDEAWLIDPENMSVITGAGEGELYLGGPGLALGYTDAEQTDARFVDVPAAGRRLFRTRDRVARGPDGALRYLGRYDRQVKHLGRWIDLNDVEAGFARHPVVSWVHAVYDTVAGRRDMTVFYMTAGGGAVSEREMLALAPQGAAGPGYVFVHVAALPLNLNGKVDVAALVAAAHAGQQARPDEDGLMELWANVLPTGAIDDDTDFFEAGGDSLAAMNLILATETRFGISLPSNFLMECPRFGMFRSTVFSATGRQFLATLRNPNSRKLLVMVPWPAGSPYNFINVLDALPEDYRIVSFDYREIRRAGMDGTIAAIRRFLIGPIMELDFDTVSFAGHSLGGIIALDLAAELERRGVAVGKVVLIDSYHPRAIVPLQLGRRLRRLAGRVLPAARSVPPPAQDSYFAAAQAALGLNLAVYWRYSPRVPRAVPVVHLQAAGDLTSRLKRLDKWYNRLTLRRAIPHLVNGDMPGTHVALIDREFGPEIGRTIARYLG